MAVAGFSPLFVTVFHCCNWEEYIYNETYIYLNRQIEVSLEILKLEIILVTLELLFSETKRKRLEREELKLENESPVGK